MLLEIFVFQVFPSWPTLPLWNETIIGLMTYIDVTNQFIATSMAL
jgi:hypothetical protein